MHIKKKFQSEFHLKYFLFGRKNLKTKFFKSLIFDIFWYSKVSSSWEFFYGKEALLLKG